MSEERYLDIIINDRGFTNKEPQISYGICPTLRSESHGNLPKVVFIEVDEDEDGEKNNTQETIKQGL